MSTVAIQDYDFVICKLLTNVCKHSNPVYISFIYLR